MHEFRGQPVDQLRIDGPLALRAEIFQNLGKTRAEELAPQAVDEGARGERILLGDDPVRQIQARGAAAIGFQLGKKRRDGRLHDFVRFIHPVGARQNARDARARGFGEDHARHLGGKQIALGAQAGQPHVSRLEFRRRKFEVIQHGVLLLGAALVLLPAQDLGQIGWQAAAGGDG